MLKLERKEPADRKRQGLKILTPNQMVNGLPISLAQLRFGNNSQKLKKEKKAYKKHKSLIGII